jgi:hypothetical protein
MCALSYTVGPHMYHPTRLPSRGTNGVLVFVNVFISRGVSRVCVRVIIAAASGSLHHGVGAQQPHVSGGPNRG